MLNFRDKSNIAAFFSLIGFSSIAVSIAIYKPNTAISESIPIILGYFVSGIVASRLCTKIHSNTVNQYNIKMQNKDLDHTFIKGCLTAFCAGSAISTFGNPVLTFFATFFLSSIVHFRGLDAAFRKKIEKQESASSTYQISPTAYEDNPPEYEDIQGATSYVETVEHVRKSTDLMKLK